MPEDALSKRSVPTRIGQGEEDESRIDLPKQTLYDLKMFVIKSYNLSISMIWGYKHTHKLGRNVVPIYTISIR